MVQDGKALRGLFRRRYLAALAVIALLGIALAVLTRQHVDAQAGRAELITLASSQKAASQRLSFLLNARAQADTPVRRDAMAEEAAAVARGMREAHAVLSGEGATEIRRRQLASVAELYDDPDRPFTEQVAAYLDSIEKLLDLPEDSPAAPYLLEEVNMLGLTSILQPHGVVMEVLQQEGEEAVAAIGKLQDALLAAIGATLLLVGLAIFEPTGRLVEDAVTRVSRAEAEAQADAARVQQLSEERANLLRVLNHELRTPLNALGGMAAILSDTELDERQAECVAQLRMAARHVLRLAEDLAAHEDGADGRLGIETEPFDLRRLVEDAAALAWQAADEKGLSLEVEIEEEALATYELDPIRLGQVLVNLLRNAVKFTDEGGVALRAGLGADGDVRFEVQDTGSGVPDDLREAVFEQFVQGAALGDRKGGGVGLGLTIARSLAEAMSGTLELVDTSARGSTFVLSVPLERHADPVPALTETAPTSAGGEAPMQVSDAGPTGRALVRHDGQRTVLIVDDVLPNRLVLDAFLKKAGYRTVMAENGQEALERVEEEEGVDLVLMDIEMPVLDGAAATKTIRDREGDPRVLPVIAVTAHVLPQDVPGMIAVGFDEVLHKPVTEEAIREAVARYLTETRGAA